MLGTLVSSPCSLPRVLQDQQGHIILVPLSTSWQSVLPIPSCTEAAPCPRPLLSLGLPPKATSSFPRSSLVLPLLGWPCRPWGGLAGSWDAETRALRHCHPTVTLLPRTLGWELRRDPWKHAREQSDRHEGTENSQAISLWMFPRCFHPQSPERPWRDTSHRFSLF